MPIKRTKKSLIDRLSIKALYFYVAAFVGLVSMFVGGMNALNTFMRHEVFNVEYEYVEFWQCTDRSESEVSMTPEEVALCEEQMIEQAKVNYENNAKSSYASGVSGLLIGFIFWLPHFLWARRLH